MLSHSQLIRLPVSAVPSQAEENAEDRMSLARLLYTHECKDLEPIGCWGFP